MNKNFKNQKKIKSFEENNISSEIFKKILNELYEKEFSEVFSDIITISKKDFFETISFNIKKSLINEYNTDIINDENFLSLIKTCQYKYEKKYDEYLIEINQFIGNFKRSNDKDNKNNYITNFQKHCLNTDYYARHKCIKFNKIGYLIPISIVENKNKAHNNKNFPIKFEEKSDYIKYVVCLACKKIYLSNKFLNFCSSCDTNYFSHIFKINEEQNLMPIAWNNNHCEFTLNEKIICSKCRSQIYIDIKNKLIKCLNCKTSKEPNNTERICKICNAKFTSKILIYNQFEENEINKIINNTLTAKKKAKPKKQHSCKNKNNEPVEYIHNNSCEGKLYLYDYNKQIIIVCEKCKKAYNYENFIWTCPYCKETFQENKNEIKANIIELPKDLNRMKRNNSNSIFKKYFNMRNKNLGIKINEEIIEKDKNLPKNDEYNKKPVDNEKNISNEKDNKNNNQNNIIDYFKISIKVRERKPLRNIRSQAHLYQYKTNENVIKILNNEDDRNEIKENIKKNEEKSRISFFRRYRNNNIKTLNNQKIINQQKEKIEEKSKNTYDDNLKINNKDQGETNNVVNQQKHFKQFYEKKGKEQTNGIQLISNFINNKNEESIKFSNYFLRKNRINDNNNILKNKSKNKEEPNIQKIKNIEINSFPKNISNTQNKAPKYVIKNYLINNSKEKYKYQKTTNNKVETQTTKNNLINENKIQENLLNYNTKKEEEEEKISITAVSKRSENKHILKTPIQHPSKMFSNFELNKSSFNSQKKKINNLANINTITNSIINSNRQSKINENKFSYIQKTETDIRRKERTKVFSPPNRILKLNKPADIIEPEDIDTSKDFPINDPYLLSNSDLYEEIQDKLKEIMYTKKIPLFNPDLYKIEKKIGEGTHGSIFQVSNLKNGKKYAIKKILCNDIILLKYIKKEFELVYEVIHPNILSIYGIFIKCFDSTTFCLSVLMDLGETDWEIEISQRYEEKKYYREEELISILKQMVSGLVYLQKEKEIAHRDIKPENVIVFKNNVYKLGDFGEAKETKNGDKLSTLRGTDTYMSPILYEGLKMGKEDVVHDIYKSDVFSLGYSILYAVALTHEIIKEIRDLYNMEDIKKTLYKKMKPRYSNNFINILLKMINPEEGKRVDFITLDKLINQ